MINQDEFAINPESREGGLLNRLFPEFSRQLNKRLNEADLKNVYFSPIMKANISNFCWEIIVEIMKHQEFFHNYNYLILHLEKLNNQYKIYNTVYERYIHVEKGMKNIDRKILLLIYGLEEMIAAGAKDFQHEVNEFLEGIKTVENSFTTIVDSYQKFQKKFLRQSQENSSSFNSLTIETYLIIVLQSLIHAAIQRKLFVFFRQDLFTCNDVYTFETTIQEMNITCLRKKENILQIRDNFTKSYSYFLSNKHQTDVVLLYEYLQPITNNERSNLDKKINNLKHNNCSPNAEETYLMLVQEDQPSPSSTRYSRNLDYFNSISRSRLNPIEEKANVPDAHFITILPSTASARGKFSKHNRRFIRAEQHSEEKIQERRCCKIL